MSRQAFGSWGAGLDDATFANALASVGAAFPQSASDSAGELETLHWFGHATPLYDGLPSALGDNASAHASRWLQYAHAPRQVRIVIDLLPTPQGLLDLQWLVTTLKSASCVRSVHFAASRPEQARSWDWPLDVGVLDDAAGRSLLVSIGVSHFQEFARLSLARNAVAPLDLLLVPASLPGALASLLAAPRLPAVHTVIALGGVGMTPDALALMEAARLQIGAAVTMVCEVERDNTKRWLGDLIYQLSHDQPLDQAIFAVSSAHYKKTPLIVADARQIGAARGSAVMKAVTRKLVEGVATLRNALPPRMIHNLGIGPAASSDAISRAIEDGAASLPWAHESDTATDLVEMAQRADRIMGDRVDERRVQGRVFWIGTAEERALTGAPLRAGELHRLSIRIGRTDEAWTSSPVAFPDSHSSAQQGNELRVVLVAPGVLAEPQTASLWLPAIDDSEPCSFHFVTPPEANELDARVTILHENRILQTLRIRASIGEHLPPRPLEIRLETVLNARLDRISGGVGFDAALLFNDALNQDGVTAFVGESAAYLTLHNVNAVVHRLRRELENITDNPDDFDAMESEGTRELFVTLARAGAEFRCGLSELNGMDRVLPTARGPHRRPLRLQVLSMHENELIPLEICYDRRSPKPTATLCPRWRTALQEGDCGQDCPSDDGTHVCPLGFWGLFHVIERKLWHSDDSAALQARRADFAIGSEAPAGRLALTRLKHVLFGRATKATAFDPPAFALAVQEIKNALSVRAIGLLTADDWESWTEHVLAQPEILLIIGHTQEEMGASTLQIGVESIVATDLGERHVRLPSPPSGTPGPVVLLFACRSGVNDVPFSGFVGAFRRAKASVVIGTMSTVRGRHMAPVAKIALDVVLARASGERRTMGEMLVELRREVLSSGLPVGLTFIGYGDVDWQIGGQA